MSAEQILHAVVFAVVVTVLFLSGVALLSRLGLQPETELSSVNVTGRDRTRDRDLSDRLGPLLMFALLLGSMALGTVVVDWLL
jgi:hypothetical protein